MKNERLIGDVSIIKNSRNENLFIKNKSVFLDAHVFTYVFLICIRILALGKDCFGNSNHRTSRSSINNAVLEIREFTKKNKRECKNPILIGVIPIINDFSPRLFLLSRSKKQVNQFN